jgi:hypothetical protein
MFTLTVRRGVQDFETLSCQTARSQFVYFYFLFKPIVEVGLALLQQRAAAQKNR